MKRTQKPVEPKIAKDALLKALYITRKGLPVDGEPVMGFFGIRAVEELPAPRNEVMAALKAHFPKGNFTWLN